MRDALPPDDGPVDLYQALQHSMQRAFFGMVLGVCLLGALAMPLLATRLGWPLRLAMLAGYGAVAATAWRALRQPAGRSASALTPLVLLGMAVVAVVAAGSGWGLQTPGLLFFGMAVCMVHALGQGTPALLVTGAALAVVSGLGGAELAGWLPQPAPSPSLVQRVVLHGASIVAGALVGHAVSIALRAHAQAAAGREQRFRGLLGMATSAYWETGADLRLTVATWRNSRGAFVPMRDAAGALPWDLTGVGLDAEAAVLLRDAMQARRPLSDLPTFWVRHGAVSHFRLNAEPRFDSGGQFRGYWGVARDVTAEQQARAAQASSEARYRELFDILPSALTLHRRGVVIDANRASAQLFGHASVADMIGRNLVDEHFAEADRPTVLQRLAEVEAQAPGVGLPPVQVQAHDSTGRRFTLSSVGVRTDHRGAPAVLSISTDETARLRAAGELARTQALLSNVVAMSPDVIALTDVADGRYVMVNTSFTRVLGYDSTEVLGRTALELGLWREPALREKLTQRLAKGTVLDAEVEMVAKDGHGVPLLIAATLLEVDGRRYALTNGRDLTEVNRVRLEREAILGNASVGIAFTRAQRFELANAQFEQMLGWPPGGLAGQTGRCVFPSDEAYAALSAAVGPALAAGEAVDIETLVARRDGSTFQARLRAKAIDPCQPATSGTIWIAEDVTEERLAAQALARALEAAEAASRAKSDFLANTSHEIRTPLNGLTGLARLARQPGLPAERLQQYLAQIDDSAQLLSSILSDILDVAKIEAGKLQLETAPFDLPALLHGLQQAYGALADHQGLAFEADLDPALPPRVVGDALRVRQVLANFLHNALKFTAQGGVRLVVRALPGERVRFEVHDTGPGLDAATQARLFQPFTQADASTTRRFGGTGLGLSICRELATLMGGSVGVHSAPGMGSCFHAELPLPAAPAEAGPATDHTSTAGQLQGARVLLVEDNAVNMMVCEALLADWGVQVTPATDGAQALAEVARAAAAGRLFDAVLMDVQMPGMSGYEATQALRRDHAAEVLPVIALTAGALVSERDSALAHGMTDFLTKPIDPQRLQAALRRATAGRARPSDRVSPA